MIPVFQSRFGPEGNCWPAVLASMLEIPLEEVDHCSADNLEWEKATEQFLADRGLYCMEIDIGTSPNLNFTQPPEGALVMTGWEKDKHCHTVISRVRPHSDSSFDLDTVHDPNPTQKMGSAWTLISIMTLCRLDK
jgi:hypothetical protein